MATKTAHAARRRLEEPVTACMVLSGPRTGPVVMSVVFTYLEAMEFVTNERRPQATNFRRRILAGSVVATVLTVCSFVVVLGPGPTSVSEHSALRADALHRQPSVGHMRLANPLLLRQPKLVPAPKPTPSRFGAWRLNAASDPCSTCSSAEVSSQGSDLRLQRQLSGFVSRAPPD